MFDFLMLVSAIIFITTDFVYLNVIKDYFLNQIKLVQGSEPKVNFLGVALCYIFLIAGINYFIIKPHKSVNDAFLLVEAISENILLKEKLFNQLDKLTPNDCILASNTSSISITSLASFTGKPGKVIGMHFMNPVPVMQLVEIIPGLLTEKEVTDKVIEISILLNKTPFVVSDFPGFISNRILMPMINEAILSLQEKVAGVNEIDQIMKLGMAHPMGPLQLADYIGLDVCLSILNVLKDGFGNPKYAPAVLLINMVKAGKLGVKSGEGFYKYNDLKKISGISALFAN